MLRRGIELTLDLFFSLFLEAIHYLAERDGTASCRDFSDNSFPTSQWFSLRNLNRIRSSVIGCLRLPREILRDETH